MNDLNWLIANNVQEDLIGIKEKKVLPIIECIRSLKTDNLPYTIGLFGTWGSGKTTLLAYLEEEYLKENQRKVIYFNAWKYAGFMEIVPSLVYKILKLCIDTDDPSKGEKILLILSSLGKKYSREIGGWIKNYIGINPVELMTDIKEIVSNYKNGKNQKYEILESYYSQIDKAQKLLSDYLKEEEKPIIVLLDELDRCDPEEAFEVIKQLRVFFAMHGVPIIFILSVNPDPIGLAIKHKYGLDDENGIYEAKRILEKFVDNFFDMSDLIILDKYVESLWGKDSIKNINFIAYLESIFKIQDTEESIESFNSYLSVINTVNPYYNNLRVLKKSFKSVFSSKKITNHFWVAWHLEILKQTQSELRSFISKTADEISFIAIDSAIQVLRKIEIKTIDSKAKELKVKDGNTPFLLYKNLFFDNGLKIISKINNQQKRTPKEDEKIDILKKIFTDSLIIDFMANMTLLNNKIDLEDIDNSINEFRSNEGHLRFVLANY